MSKGGKKREGEKIGGATRIKNSIDINSFLRSRAVFPNIAMQEDENFSQYDGDCQNTLILITLRLAPIQQMFWIINILLLLLLIIKYLANRG